MDHDDVILPGGGNQCIQRPGDGGFAGPSVGQYGDVLRREPLQGQYFPDQPHVVAGAGGPPAPGRPVCGGHSPGGESNQPASSKPMA
jgi:hypothetical protein